jgi:hypothetical protein
LILLLLFSLFFLFSLCFDLLVFSLFFELFLSLQSIGRLIVNLK